VHTLAPVATPCHLDDDICTHEACDDKGACLSTGEVNTCAEQAAAYPCWAWICNASSGCLQTTYEEGNPCDDGDACTSLDECVVDPDGVKMCQGSPTELDDGNSCTTDFCDASGVQHVALEDDTLCDSTDPAACDGQGACFEGICVVTQTCSCTQDEDCDPTSWCRATEAGGTSCTPYQEEGEPCGGFVLPWMLEKCLPTLTCLDVDPMIADEPGICGTPQEPPDPGEGLDCDAPEAGTACWVAPVEQDTWLESSSVQGSQSWLILGKHDTYPKKRSLLQFDLSGVPDGVTVLAATMKVYFVYAHKASGSNEVGVDRVIGAHQVLVPWDEGSANKTNALAGHPWSSPLCGVDGSDAVTEPEDSQLFQWQVTKVWHDFDLTDLTASWLEDPSGNHGVLLMAQNEDTPGRDMRIRSSNASEVEEHAVLEVVYSVP